RSSRHARPSARRGFWRPGANPSHARDAVPHRRLGARPGALRHPHARDRPALAAALAGDPHVLRTAALSGRGAAARAAPAAARALIDLRAAQRPPPGGGGLVDASAGGVSRPAAVPEAAGAAAPAQAAPAAE